MIPKLTWAVALGASLRGARLVIVVDFLDYYKSTVSQSIKYLPYLKFLTTASIEVGISDTVRVKISLVEFSTKLVNLSFDPVVRYVNLVSKKSLVLLNN